MLIFHLFRNASLTLKFNISVNIARKIECYISKSKLILCEWSAFYFSEIAFIEFTLLEIKQCIVFFGTPGTRANKTRHIKIVTQKLLV